MGELMVFPDIKKARDELGEFLVKNPEMVEQQKALSAHLKGLPDFKQREEFLGTAMKGALETLSLKLKEVDIIWDKARLDILWSLKNE